jgi:hypothetical protein
VCHGRSGGCGRNALLKNLCDTAFVLKIVGLAQMSETGLGGALCGHPCTRVRAQRLGEELDGGHFLEADLACAAWLKCVQDVLDGSTT